ncbi:aminoglycoside phosphotransferase family protein [Thermodesulfobacteriota bacterium]
MNPIPSDGSSRIFHRLVIPDSKHTFIIMENTPSSKYLEKENNAYLMIGKHLFDKGLPLPEILSWDLKNGWFLLEDMGGINLQKAISRDKESVILYEKVLEVLFRLQVEGSRNFDPDWCCQTKYYDMKVMRRYESDYFRDSFLSDYLGLNSIWNELEAPFDYLALMASKAKNEYFLHRDFQSRNIMIKGEEIGILDWQGGRLGPLGYDIASLIVDPYPNNTTNEKEEIYQLYLTLLKETRPELVDDFETYFPYLSLQRNLQILGAFSHLTKVKNKPFFASYISPTLKSLQELLIRMEDQELSPLKDIVDKVLDMEDK